MTEFTSIKDAKEDANELQSITRIYHLLISCEYFPRSARVSHHFWTKQEKSMLGINKVIGQSQLLTMSRAEAVVDASLTLEPLKRS